MIKDSDQLPDLPEVLAAWAAAMGGKSRLQRVETVRQRGKINTFTERDYGFCGSLETIYDTQGNERVVLILAGNSSLITVANRRKDQIWFVNGDSSAIPAPPLLAEIIRGRTFLTSYSWLFSGRLPGSISVVGQSAERIYLESKASGAVPFRISLDRTTHLPVEIELSSSLVTPLGSRRIPTQSETALIKIEFVDWSSQNEVGILLPSELTIKTKTSSSRPDRVIFETCVVNRPIPPRCFAKPRPKRVRITYPNPEHRVEFPFTLHRGDTFIETRVDRSAPLTFGLDTGTSVNIIHSQDAERLGLDYVCSFKQVLGGGTQATTVKVTQPVKLNVADLKMKVNSVLAINLDPISRVAVGAPLGGILGGEFLRKLILTIDYEHQRAILVDRSRVDPEEELGDITLTVAAESGVPLVRAKLFLPGRDKPLTALLLVDTGAQAALILNRPFIKKNKLLDAISPRITTQSFGLAGRIFFEVGRLPMIQLGSLNISNPVVALATRGGGSLDNAAFDGFIGADILGRTRFVLDSGGNRLGLTPYPGFEDPYEFGGSGLRLIAQGQHYDRFEIAFIIADSPASDAGLRIGDVIVSVDGQSGERLTLDAIDGQSGERLTLDAILSSFDEFGRTFDIGFDRRGNRRHTELTTRRLI